MNTKEDWEIEFVDKFGMELQDLQIRQWIIDFISRIRAEAVSKHTAVLEGVLRSRDEGVRLDTICETIKDFLAK